MTGGAPAGGEEALEGRLLGGHYLVGERIGSGSMGVVHRARHTLLHRDFAVKVLSPAFAQDPEARSRFLKEAEGLARIVHPNVVPVRHFGEEGGRPFLVMDLFEGETLRDLLAREGPLPERRAAGIALQVLQALDAAHWEGVVHRDLKPANILLAPGDGDRGGERVRVVDFGLARVAGASALPGAQASAPGAVAGTVAYMSPEQVRGGADLDGRSDLFTLGAVIHEMVGGRPPFEGPSTLTVAMKILEQAPAPLPEEGPRGVSAPVRAVLARALEKDRERRFATAGEMADALREAIAGFAPASAGANPDTRRRRVMLAALLGAGALAAAVAALQPGRPSPGKPEPYGPAEAAADRALARRSLLDGRFEGAAAAEERLRAAGLAAPEDRLVEGIARAELGDGSILEALVPAGAGGNAAALVERARFLRESRFDYDGAAADIVTAFEAGAGHDALFELTRWTLARESLLRASKAPITELEPLRASFADNARLLGDDPRRGIVESMEAEARGDLDRAREVAEKASAAAPDVAEAADRLGSLCDMLGFRARLPDELDLRRRWHEAALRAHSDAVARAKRRPDLFLQGREIPRYWRSICNTKYALGDVEGAAADYENEIVARNPGFRDDRSRCAQYLQWAGRYEDALRSYAAARRAGSGDTNLHGEAFCRMQSGRVKAEAGDLPGALADLDAAVEAFTAGDRLHPGNSIFRVYRGEAWVTRARLLREEAAAASLAKAREDFDALAAGPHAAHPETLFRRWDYLEATRDRAGALDAIRKAMAPGEGLTPAYFRRLAHSCIQSAGDSPDPRPLLEEALRAADAAERWAPRKAELSHLLRGEAHLRLGDAAAARGDFDRAATLARLDIRVRAEAKLRSSRAALAAGDPPAAVDDAEEACRLREAANVAGRSSLFVDDFYLRSPLAEYHEGLAAACEAAGRPGDAAKARARAAALR